MFKKATYMCCCRYHVPRVRNHPTAVVHHLTHAPRHENKKVIESSQGSGTETNPFIVYRSSDLIGQENLKKLRFVCMSDTHNEHTKLHIPSGDVFVHCGDAVQFLSSARDIRKFNQFVGQLPHKYKLFVSGNHCVCFDPTRPDETQKLLSNMTYLQDQLIDIEGVKIYGTPWRPKRGWLYPAEAFGYDPKLIREDKWINIPEDIDFLLTHGPSYSIRDHHPLTDERLGCPDLLVEIVTRVRPRAHLFGHMHTCRGASVYKSEDNTILEGDKFKTGSHDILFVNLAIHQGKTLGEPVVIDYYY